MPKSGLWITVGGERLAEAVARSIDAHEQFSTTVIHSEIKPRSAELVLVSLSGELIDYVGISQVGRRVATGQITVGVSNLQQLGVPCKDIQSALPPRFSKSFRVPPIGAGRPTPKLWEELLKAIRAKLPAAGSSIDGLNRTISASQVQRGRLEGGLEVFERDAVASALQVFGGSAFRKKVLRKAGAPARADAAPFLLRLRDVAIREDPQIIHDQAVFPGMDTVRRDVIGSVVLTDGKDFLTIVNCNRQPLEI